jgi:hypothetical protein
VSVTTFIYGNVIVWLIDNGMNFYLNIYPTIITFVYDKGKGINICFIHLVCNK